MEVLGYQNTAANLAAGPNAMPLHLPAQSVTSGQFLPADRAVRVLRSIAGTVSPAAAGPDDDGFAWMGADTHAEVFQHDIYTVVLAEDASHISAALEQVEQVELRKRSLLNHCLFDFYADCFPGFPVALCCFDNAEGRAIGKTRVVSYGKCES